MVLADERLRILAGANMKLFPDHDLTLAIDQGCAGVAWRQAIAGSINDCWKPVYAPDARLTPDHLERTWKLTQGQIDATRHVRWILSLPLFLKEGTGRRFLGVLNFDGVGEQLADPSRVEHNDFLGTCVAFGERIAEILVDDRLVM